MACERNRVLELKKYFESLGIDVNIGNNKARGHQGVFLRGRNSFRIDISKELKDEEKILSVMMHEFGHFIHYNYDNNLSSLNFVFEDLTDEIKEELIKITVQDVSKQFATSVYTQKQQVNKDIKSLVSKLKQVRADFKLSQKYLPIETRLSRPYKYLFSYDNVNYFGKIYSVKRIQDYDLNEDEKLYIQIKSQQRMLKRINSKINKINKYYNNPSELFARFIASFYTKNEYTQLVAPLACKKLADAKLPHLEKLNDILLTPCT